MEPTLEKSQKQKSLPIALPINFSWKAEIIIFLASRLSTMNYLPEMQVFKMLLLL